MCEGMGEKGKGRGDYRALSVAAHTLTRTCSALRTQSAPTTGLSPAPSARPLSLFQSSFKRLSWQTRFVSQRVSEGDDVSEWGQTVYLSYFLCPLDGDDSETGASFVKRSSPCS